IFELIEGEGDKAVLHPLFSIPKILQKILEIGRRGVQIKRFKGLGEMNAKELFETTMNPEKRKLLKVDLNEDNAVDADKMVTILMGRHGRPPPPIHRRQCAKRAQSRRVTRWEVCFISCVIRGAVTQSARFRGRAAIC